MVALNRNGVQTADYLRLGCEIAAEATGLVLQLHKDDRNASAVFFFAYVREYGPATELLRMAGYTENVNEWGDGQFTHSPRPPPRQSSQRRSGSPNSSRR